MRIFVLGSLWRRTPFSYAPYKALFRTRFDYVARPEDADVIILAYVADIYENFAELARLRDLNPAQRIVVVSEEPLWDTAHSGDFRLRHNSRNADRYTFDYSVINHHTSGAYRFDHLPYFLTTTDDFYLRYAQYFAQNAALSTSALTEAWSAPAIRAAFFAEFRDVEEKYAFAHPEIETWGLSVYRSRVAQKMPDDTLRVGRGWGTEVMRQALPDWHLDKIATLRGRSLIVSALENTSQNDYVSEKIFDAFACRGVPLYWCPSGHAANRLVPPQSYINLFGMEPDAAVARITAFRADSEFVEAYAEAQRRLRDLFRNFDAFIDARIGFFNRISDDLMRIVAEPQG